MYRLISIGKSSSTLALKVNTPSEIAISIYPLVLNWAALDRWNGLNAFQASRAHAMLNTAAIINKTAPSSVNISLPLSRPVR